MFFFKFIFEASHDDEQWNEEVDVDFTSNENLKCDKEFTGTIK